tara:strand:+ start:169 stop:810 length:642 start_codon:yes stop_codon:yes gene_type:complete
MSIVISNKSKFIFFHLPKNAGTSVSDLLLRNENFYYSRICISKILKNFTKKDNIFFDSYEKKLLFFRSHETLKYMESVLSPKIFNDYYKFAVVRNPFGRFVSRYNYTKKNFNNNDLKFNEFLQKHIKSNYMTDRQYEFLLNNKNQIGVDKILRFENINNDLETISDKIKVNLKDFNKLNSSTFDNYRDYYDDDTKRIVEKFCKKDLDYFNYDF